MEFDTLAAKLIPEAEALLRSPNYHPILPALSARSGADPDYGPLGKAICLHGKIENYHEAINRRGGNEATCREELVFALEVVKNLVDERKAST
jgi:hypothetical protein